MLEVRNISFRYTSERLVLDSVGFTAQPGEVVAVNEELESTPTLVNVSPYGEGWMIRIRPDASAESLLDAAGYRALLGL